MNKLKENYRKNQAREYEIKSLYTAIGYCIANHELELVRRNANNTATLCKGKKYFTLSRGIDSWELVEVETNKLVDSFNKSAKRSICSVYKR